MTYNRCMAKRDDDLEFSVNAAFDEARAVVDKVPLYLVNGSLGAGKTSVVLPAPSAPFTRYNAILSFILAFLIHVY
jgi:hypothetical protein